MVLYTPTDFRQYGRHGAVDPRDGADSGIRDDAPGGTHLCHEGGWTRDFGHSHRRRRGRADREEHLDQCETQDGRGNRDNHLRPLREVPRQDRDIGHVDGAVPSDHGPGYGEAPLFHDSHRVGGGGCRLDERPCVPLCGPPHGAVIGHPAGEGTPHSGPLCQGDGGHIGAEDGLFRGPQRPGHKLHRIRHKEDIEWQDRGKSRPRKR